MDEVTSKRALRDALVVLGMTKGSERGLYASIARRSPLRIDDEVPAFVKARLEQNQTCACTDSNVVYVDTSKAARMFKKAREAASEGSSDVVTSSRAEDNYRTLLVHEYTHVIMRHVESGIKFVRANGDKNYPIFALACDIEANRGYGIVPDSDLYQIAVTDKFYPECKGVEGLMNIYRVLKKNYGDEILQDYQKMKQEADDEGEAQEESEGEKDSDSESGGKSDESMTPEEQKHEQRKEALKNAMDSMERMKEEMEQRASMMTEEELSDKVDDFDEEEGHGLMIDDYGTGEGTANANPYDVLQSEYKKSIVDDVEKAMETLKGLVRGSQIKSRVKTYSRQSRRESADGLIRKGVKNKKALAPRILVAMDSSGSMYKSEVTPIATAIGTIAKMLGKTKGSYICEHESHVKNVKPLSKWEDVVKGYYADGDNNFDEVLAKAIELNVEMVLDIGDGFARFHDIDIMKQAHAKGIKWVDVQVCGEEQVLKNIISDDEYRHGKNFIGREILKVGED